MSIWIKYSLSLVTLLLCGLSFAQQDTTQSGGENIDQIRNEFIQGVGEFFDVRMLDHSIQTRGLVKKQGLKDQLDAFGDKTEDKLRIALISNLDISELWPNLLNRKKYYTTDGKYDVGDTYFFTGETEEDLPEGVFLIGVSIDVDTLTTKEEYTVEMQGVLDQSLITYLTEKSVNVVQFQADINAHFTQFFTNNPPPFDKPNEIPVPEAMEGLFPILDQYLDPFYHELLVQQMMQDLADETFPEASDEFRITFNPASGQNYGFDEFDTRFENWADQYGFAMQGDGNIYQVAAKSVKAGEPENVDVFFEHSGTTTIDYSKVTFEIKGEDATINSISQDAATIEIPALSKGKEELYAYYDGDPIGKLLIKVYEQKDVKVVIVPVNCNVAVSDFETYLDMVYKPAVVDWIATVAPRWNDSSWDSLTPGQLEATDATLMTKYSNEMRDLRDAYFDFIGDDEDKEAYYLFVVNDFTESSLGGYMVRGKSVGFIKNSTSDVVLKRTVAHELGHGAFGLRHHFDLAPQGQTDRLMDYVTATHLTAFDWHEIHSKAPEWGRFDDEEEAEFLSLIFYQNIGYYKWSETNLELQQKLQFHSIDGFRTPSGFHIKLTDITKVEEILFDVVTGGVGMFRYDGVLYKSQYSYNSGKSLSSWCGYVRADHHDKIIELSEERGYVPINVEEQAQLLKDISNMYFCEYDNVAPTNMVAMLIRENGSDVSCERRIIKSPGQTTKIKTDPCSNTEGKYMFRHFGHPDVTDLDEFNSVQVPHYVIDDEGVLSGVSSQELSDEMRGYMCAMSLIYSNQASFGFYFIEEYLVNRQMTFSGLTSLSEETVEYLYEISSIYEEFGGELLSSYSRELMNKGTFTNLNNAFYNLLGSDFDTHPVPENKSEYIQFLKQKFAKFKSEMKSVNIDNGQSNIALDIISNWTDAELRLLNVKTRTGLLTELSLDYMTDGEENISVRLIKTVDVENATAFLNELSKPSGALYQLVGADGGVFSGIDTHTKNAFYAALFNLYEHYVDPDMNPHVITLVPAQKNNNSVACVYDVDEQSAIGSNVIVEDHLNFLGDKTEVSYQTVVSHDEDHSINYLADPSAGDIVVSHSYQNIYDSETPHEIVLKTFDPVYLEIIEGEERFYSLIDSDFKIGELYVVPSFFLLEIYKTRDFQFKQDAVQVLAIAADLFTIYKGVPAFTAAWRTGRMVTLMLEGAELVASAGNLTVFALGDAIPEEYHGLVDSYNMLVGLMGLTNLTTLSYSAIINKAKSIDWGSFKTRTNAFLTNIKNTDIKNLPSVVKAKILALYKLISKSDLEDDMWGWVTTEGLRNKVDELNDPALKQQFIDDFANANSEIKTALNNTPDLVNEWTLLNGTQLGIELPWLYRLKSWRELGVNSSETNGVISFSDDKGIQFARIEGNSLIYNYNGFGGDIIVKGDRVTTVLGKWQEIDGDPNSMGTWVFLGKNGGLENGIVSRVTNIIPPKNSIAFLDLPPEPYSILMNRNIKTIISESPLFNGDFSKLDLIYNQDPWGNALFDLIQNEVLPLASASEIQSLLDIGRELGKKEFWDTYNLPFLEKAFQRGDDIRLVSDPNPSSGTRTGTYADELDEIDNHLMQQHNYHYNSQTKTYEKL